MILTRRELIRRGVAAGATVLAGGMLAGCRETPEMEGAAGAAPGEPAYPPPSAEDLRRLEEWVGVLRREGFGAAGAPLGLAAVRVGELAVGTPYEPHTLEEYLLAGDSPSRTEPLTLRLDRFDCVTLVESCLAIARLGRAGAEVGWDDFGREMERMRYRGGVRAGYTSRLHYFSEWLHDNERRGLVRMLGREMGGTPDTRPLRFMSEHPDAYRALADADVRAEIGAIERRLDDQPRWVIPTERIPAIADRIHSGDVLAFATSIEGLDVTHSAFAYRDAANVVRVLHAPLSGGVVEVTRSTLQEYVAGIRRSTGILLARPV
jgi:hypothetical protein